jgi:hypothetical protein
MILAPLLAIRQTFYSSLLIVLLSVLIKLKNTKISLLIKLSFVFLTHHQCLATTSESWGHKTDCLLLHVARRGQEEEPPFSPRVRYKHSSHP